MLHNLNPPIVKSSRVDRAILQGGERIRLAKFRCDLCGRRLRACDFKIFEDRIELTCPDDGADLLSIELRP